VLQANYRKVPFSGAAKHLNEAAIARYFGQLSEESPDTRTCWRREEDLNLRPFILRMAFLLSSAFSISE
jgi:hypothetical protein